MANLRSALGKAIGLGAAKSGTHHWLAQRVSALALIPLSLWFAYSLIELVRLPREEAIEWFGSAGNATGMVFFLIAIFYHGFLGVQVVIEDYVRHKGVKFALLIFMQLACFAASAAGIFSLLSLYFKG